MDELSPAEISLAVVSGKWKMRVLSEIVHGVNRFSQLQRAIPSITPRVLSRTLRELEEDRLVRRTVHDEVPVKVDYTVTELGESLGPLLGQLHRWGSHYARTAAAIGGARRI